MDAAETVQAMSFYRDKKGAGCGDTFVSGTLQALSFRRRAFDAVSRVLLLANVILCVLPEPLNWLMASMPPEMLCQHGSECLMSAQGRADQVEWAQDCLWSRHLES